MHGFWAGVGRVADSVGDLWMAGTQQDGWSDETMAESGVFLSIVHSWERLY